MSERFVEEGFRVGPHKAYQLARDAARVRVLLVSEMPPGFVRQLPLELAASLDDALSTAMTDLLPGALPIANATIPFLTAYLS